MKGVITSEHEPRVTEIKKWKKEMMWRKRKNRTRSKSARDCTITRKCLIVINDHVSRIFHRNSTNIKKERGKTYHPQTYSSSPTATYTLYHPTPSSSLPDIPSDSYPWAQTPYRACHSRRRPARVAGHRTSLEGWRGMSNMLLNPHRPLNGRTLRLNPREEGKPR